MMSRGRLARAPAADFGRAAVDDPDCEPAAVAHRHVDQVRQAVAPVQRHRAGTRLADRQAYLVEQLVGTPARRATAEATSRTVRTYAGSGENDMCTDGIAGVGGSRARWRQASASGWVDPRWPSSTERWISNTSPGR